MAAPLFGFISTAAQAASGFVPTSISGNILWLDGADTSAFTGGSTWTDKSGTGNHGINGTSGASSMPSATSWGNGYNAARFVAASKNSVKTTNNTPNYNLTIFYVARIQAAVGYGFFLIDNYSGQRQLAMNSSSFPVALTTLMSSSGGYNTVASFNQSVPFLYTGTLNSSTYTYYSNGTSSGTGSVTSTGTSQYYFGSANGDSGYLTMDAAEIIIYNSVLSTTNRQTVEAYLRFKWGVFKPTDYSSNVYWFDAADTSTITRSGTTVTAWANKGTGSMTFSSNTGTVSSGTTTKNGRNVVSFPTSSKLVSAATNLGITGNDETIFVVYQKRTNMTTSGVINLMYANNPNPGGNPSGFDLYYNGIAYNNDLQTNTTPYDNFWTVCGGYCFTASGNTPNYSPYVYQLLTLVVSQTTPGFWSFGGNNNGVGGGSGQRYAGCANGYATGSMTFNMGNSTVDWDLAEYIVYNRVLTTTEQQTVEGYLSVKWGIPLVSGHPYAIF